MKIHPPSPDQAPCAAPVRLRFAGGFTLIELMIVVSIVAILAALAYPSFSSQMRKSRRADAMESIMAIQQAQERWRSNNASYSTSLASLQRSGTSTNGYYTLSIASATGKSYQINANAVSGSSQAGDTGCTQLVVVVSTGMSQTPANCWSK